jgi:UDP-N-acetylglucosamine--N-acetylmuramyl-(pentapeptide) pyrophosphoryl-undecaprenol N-acetylglucosamine transferase
MIAGGGTGGHISPGIAIADALESAAPGIEVFFMGRAGSIEERLVGRTGRGFVAVPSKGLKRSADLGNLAVPFVVLAGYFRALCVLAARRPAVAVGTGGFVSMPPMLAARTLGIPVVLQEQNSYPGLATRVLSRMASVVHTSFEETTEHLPRARRVQLSGNPVRSDFEAADRGEARAKLGLPADATVVLLVGGSRGARRINEAVSDAAARLAGMGLSLIAQTGADDHATVRKALVGAGVSSIVEPFFDDVATAYAACDIVVARSGASTIAEIEITGRPSLLVPYPFATEGHQMKNAQAVAAAGAAVVIPDEELTGERLADEIELLLKDGARLALMAQRARTLARPDAAEQVAESILALDRNADPAGHGPASSDSATGTAERSTRQ